MASRSYLPAAGSTVWRNEPRSLSRSSSSGDTDTGLSRTRIKHIVIREVWKRDLPSTHALYKIDVMTQSNHWFILRRYREFHSLHMNLVKQYNIPNDMLPTKKLFSNMSLAHLEKRRNALEHYLQRLINSHHDIAESQELFQFLNVQTHDVLCVTRQLAKFLEKEGRNLLASGGVFTFSPTQMYCITRQLQLPHMAIEQSDSSNPGDETVDLGHLYGFIQELNSLCVSGVASRSSPCQELISNQAFDISLFKSLQKLQIEKCHIGVIDGLFRIQKQLTHVTLRNCLKSMKEFLIDAAMQKRAIKQAASNVESWRNMSTTKLTDNRMGTITEDSLRIVVRPWILLTHVNMSHNRISTLDHSLKLLPSLEQLDLSHNEFVHLDLEQLTSSTLTFLNLSHNDIHYVSASSGDLRNLKSLLLTNNRLQNLEGIECLRGLVELDVRYNDIKTTEELVKISSLLHLRILALSGNPCVSSKSYRIQVFCQLKARELILDGIKITESEKAKVHLIQGRKVTSTDAERSPTRKTVVKTQVVNQNEKKKVAPYMDDDQDSGFGGNYTGSVDEGGLVFDWSCYSDHIDVTLNSFSPYLCRPSTSRTMLRNHTSKINSSDNCNTRLITEYRVPSQNNLFSGTKLSNRECHGPNHGDVSAAESDMMSGSSDGHMYSDSSNYRGKQPTNRRYAKRNIRSPNSPCATLLQISLNEDAKKLEETRGKVNRPNQSPEDNIHSVTDNRKSLQENTNSFHCNSQPDASYIQDSTNMIHKNASTSQDNTNMAQNNPKNNTINFQDNLIATEDVTNTVQENTNSFQHDEKCRTSNYLNEEMSLKNDQNA